MMESNAISLQLTDIVEHDIPGITKVQAAQHMEACLICLDYHNHRTGIKLVAKGSWNANLFLYWNGEVDERMRRCWRDTQEATEYGAAAIAILLVIEFTKYTVIERSAKGTGFDYWLLESELYDEEFISDGTARLEVSGIIYAENDSAIRSRVKDKLRQVEVSDSTGFPAIIVVVEFSRPEAHMEHKR